MGLGAIVIIGIIVIIIIVALFTTITNPRDIDQEEEASVEKRIKEGDKRRRWWHRR